MLSEQGARMIKMKQEVSGDFAQKKAPAVFALSAASCQPSRKKRSKVFSLSSSSFNLSLNTT